MDSHLTFVLRIGRTNLHLHHLYHVCVYLQLVLHSLHCLSVRFEFKAISSISLCLVLSCLRSIHREVDSVEITHMSFFVCKPFSANSDLVLSKDFGTKTSFGGSTLCQILVYLGVDRLLEVLCQLVCFLEVELCGWYRHLEVFSRRWPAVGTPWLRGFLLCLLINKKRPELLPGS